MSKISQNLIQTVLWYYNQCTILFIVTCHPKIWFWPKIADMQKCAKIHALLRKLNGLLCRPCRILKLHQNLHNNIFYWNSERFPDTTIVKKMRVSLKPIKSPQNGQFWEFFWGSKNFFRSNNFLEIIPHYNQNFSIK